MERVLRIGYIGFENKFKTKLRVTRMTPSLEFRTLGIIINGESKNMVQIMKTILTIFQSSIKKMSVQCIYWEYVNRI